MSSKPRTTWAKPKPRIPAPHLLFNKKAPKPETAAPVPVTAKLVVVAFKFTPPYNRFPSLQQFYKEIIKLN
jgi:hypothetical protein